MPTVPNARLTQAQIRAYTEIQNLIAHAVPHLTRLRIAGVPSEQDEARVQHLQNACEGILNYENSLAKAQGE